MCIHVCAYLCVYMSILTLPWLLKLEFEGFVVAVDYGVIFWFRYKLYSRYRSAPVRWHTWCCCVATCLSVQVPPLVWTGKSWFLKAVLGTFWAAVWWDGRCPVLASQMLSREVPALVRLRPDKQVKTGHTKCGLCLANELVTICFGCVGLKG